MTLDFGTHLLKVTVEGIDRWDIYRVTQTKKGGTRAIAHAFGCKMEKALKIIVNDRVAHDKDGQEVSMDEFLQKYNEICEQIKETAEALVEGAKA